MSARRDDGFTLIELLVAVTLLAFLSVGLVAGLRFGTAVWSKAQVKNVDGNDMRAAQRVLSADLARIYPKFLPSLEPDRSAVDFDGTGNGVSFLSAASASGHIARSTLAAVRDRDGFALVLGAVPELARSGQGATTQTLLRRLSAVEFSYYGTLRGTKQPAWYRSWRNQPALPALIRIRAAFAGTGTTPWPEMILAPRIAADASCVFDALTKFCQGRS